MPFLITGTFLYHRHASFSGALSGGRARRARTCRGTRGAVRYERMFRDPLPTFKTHVDPPQASFSPDTSTPPHPLPTPLPHPGEEALQSLDRFLEGHQRDAMADMAREFSNGSYC